MSAILAFALVAALLVSPQAQLQISHDDAVRVAEFYRFAPQIEDQVWPGWNSVPAPLLLITPDAEILTHFPRMPEGFSPANDGFFARPRQLPIRLQATMPAFGPPSTICIGEPANTDSHDSSHWLIIAMHEHFHQLQYSKPGYYEQQAALGLGSKDDGGMWMLNYPFPYSDADVNQRFNVLRDLLLRTLNEPDPRRFRRLAKQYVRQRADFVNRLLPDDHKYFSFQLWQEGMARYTQVKVAEAAKSYQPSQEFAALPDFKPLTAIGAEERATTMAELHTVTLAKDQRLIFYAFGAGEGFLLDRYLPGWKAQYFQHLLSTDDLFMGKKDDKPPVTE